MLIDNSKRTITFPADLSNTACAIGAWNGNRAKWIRVCTKRESGSRVSIKQKEECRRDEKWKKGKRIAGIMLRACQIQAKYYNFSFSWLWTYHFYWDIITEIYRTTRRKKIDKIYRKFGTYLDTMTF